MAVMEVKPIALALSLAACCLSPGSSAAQVRLGAVGGFSLLEQKDRSLTHGPLKDEVTLGRTWLAGALLDLAPTRNDRIGLEFLFGPYHNDVDRYCISRFTSQGVVCEPQVGTEAKHALLFGIEYARFGPGRWRPYLGGGIGAKRYTFRDHPGAHPDPSTSATVSAFAGVETPGRVPVRFEVRGVLVTKNPLIYDKRQYELQARMAALLF